MRDIRALLEREGYRMRPAEISVVLTRLKSRGEIEEIKRGGGRTPAVYRKPESTTPQETKSTDQTGGTESTTESALPQSWNFVSLVRFGALSVWDSVELIKAIILPAGSKVSLFSSTTTLTTGYIAMASHIVLPTSNTENVIEDIVLLVRSIV